ncbi:MAG TPA: hypothetical protein VL625_00900 [Patescibacteria group bacterium]|nr:hypothetical protein [Patescibacteria group bacterium]
MRPVIVWVVAAIATMILAAFPAAAAQTGLTEEAIKAFYKQSADSHKRSFQDYVSFMTRAMADEFTMTDTATILMEGKPPTVTKNRETKLSFLAHVKVAYDGLKGAEITETVKKTEIAADGKSAKVFEEETVRNISFRIGGGGQYFGNGKGECEDEVVLSDSGQIQVSKSVCKSRIFVSKGQSL